MAKKKLMACVKAVLSYIELNDDYVSDLHLCEYHKKHCTRLADGKKSVEEARAAIGKKCG